MDEKRQTKMVWPRARAGKPLLLSLAAPDQEGLVTYKGWEALATEVLIVRDMWNREGGRGYSRGPEVEATKGDENGGTVG